MDWISVFSFFESSDKKGETYNVGTYHLPSVAHDARMDLTLKNISKFLFCSTKIVTWQVISFHLYALRAISIKFLNVISMLCKTESGHENYRHDHTR